MTEITLTHAQLRDEAASHGVGSGWVLCLDKLAALFSVSAAQTR